jgi:hypothetical protein
MKCPVCGSGLVVENETRGATWFAGTYVCRRHGLLRISGRCRRHGAMEHKADHWAPPCRAHGFDAVVKVGSRRFLCLTCDEEILVSDSRIKRSFPPDFGLLRIV